MSFGILTLATPHDYKKAIGLALSSRVSNPNTPIAVACSPKVGLLLTPYFDQVIPENPDLKGFEHKVHLDKYSPFETTFFFDSDVLLFKDVREVLTTWPRQSYIAKGEIKDSGVSSFGMDRFKVLQKIGRQQMMTIDGAGHALFRKPECFAVFDLAREVTAHYADYVGDAKYADEDALAIVMTLLDLKPYFGHDFFSRYISIQPGTVQMDASKGLCSYIAQFNGQRMSPYMMHFAADEAPIPYARQLYKLFKANGVSTDGLIKQAAKDFYTQSILWPLKAQVKHLFLKTGLV